MYASLYGGIFSKAIACIAVVPDYEFPVVYRYSTIQKDLVNHMPMKVWGRSPMYEVWIYFRGRRTGTPARIGPHTTLGAAVPATSAGVFAPRCTRKSGFQRTCCSFRIHVSVFHYSNWQNKVDYNSFAYFVSNRIGGNFLLHIESVYLSDVSFGCREAVCLGIQSIMKFSPTAHWLLS